MKTLLLLLSLISATHAMAENERNEALNDRAAIEQALNYADENTKRDYLLCIEEDKDGERNCESDYLGDIYN